MKILFLTDNFPPEVNAPASRTYEHCVEWVKMGAEVTVITCAPNFPHGKVFAGYQNRLFRQEMVDGIRVIRVWTYITANEGFVKRILDYISFAFSASLAALFVRTDLIIATSPQFFTAVGGWWAAFLKRKPWVMEVRDLWPESIRAVGAMKDGLLYRRLEGLECFLYRRARRVVVVTDSFRDNLIRRGIDAGKITVVKNGVNLDKFLPMEKDAGLLKELGLEGKFVVSYLGTHGMAHALDFILKSAVDAPASVHFLLIGDGAEKQKLVEMKKALGIDRITLLGSVPKDQIGRYIGISDLCLVNLRKSDTFKTVIPSKIFENAAMQKPILLGVEGEAKALVEQYGAGLAFEPENKADLLAKIALLQDPERYRQCQEGCARLAADFDRRQLAVKMLGAIE
jgi:hypothetical protein